MTAPTLSFGLSFNDLYDREGLSRLDAAFAAWLKAANADVHARLEPAPEIHGQLVGFPVGAERGGYADEDQSALLGDFLY